MISDDKIEPHDHYIGIGSGKEQFLNESTYIR